MAAEMPLEGFLLREDKWVCSSGHEFSWNQVATLRLGEEGWCLACLAEKVNPIFAALGVGRVSRKELEEP